MRQRLDERTVELELRTAERDEALARETATADVLGVINSSPGDLGPVFDAILEKAHVLCGAAGGVLAAIEGDRGRALTVHGEPKFAEFWMQQGWFRAPNPESLEQQQRGESVHILDAASEEVRSRRTELNNRLAELSGARTLLSVPLRKDHALHGVITAFRQEVRPFSDKEIALLQNFAAQAVIAMENARLLTETREALEQQTATAEILQVINSSSGDLAPVFDAILEKALTLCEAPFGLLRTWDGERFHQIAAQGDPKVTDWAWNYGPWAPAHDSSPSGRIVRGEDIVRFADAPGDEAISISPGFRALVEASGMRSGVVVALRKDDTLLGNMTVYRQEVRPFTDKQIALLQSFAAQAVIAMENARLITETREVLEQQTATAEVLQIINSSPGDLTPVFDAILEKSLTLCGAVLGALQIYDGEFFRPAAMRGLPEPFAERLRQDFRASGHPVAEALLAGERFVHISDLAATHITHPTLAPRQNSRTPARCSVCPCARTGCCSELSLHFAERKRSEAEIRAARDAAEAAYRDLKAAQASLIQAEKMASLGQLTAGIAHEIKNPLNFVNNFADLSVELLGELKETTARDRCARRRQAHRDR